MLKKVSGNIKHEVHIVHNERCNICGTLYPEMVKATSEEMGTACLCIDCLKRMYLWVRRVRKKREDAEFQDILDEGYGTRCLSSDYWKPETA